MAYSKANLTKKSVKAIEENNLVFVDEIIAYLPCSKATFYNHKLEQLDAIKSLLESNREKMKVDLKQKWYKSGNATLQIALYKLLCSPEERRKISMNYNEHASKDGGNLFSNISDEKAKELAKKIKGSSD